MMLKRSAASFLLTCLIPLLTNAQPTGGATEALLHINGKPITIEEFVYLYRKNNQHKPEEFTREKIEEYLNLFINYKLKVEEAIARGMDTTAAFRREYKTYREELLKPYLPDSKVIDSLVLLTYERLKQEVNVSHILISLRPDATPDDTLKALERISALRGRVLAGENFNALAAQYSEEPGAANTKGNLGYFTALQMVFPFEQAAYLTPVGSVSEPVRTRFGYHLVKVNDKRPTRGEVEVSHIMIRTQDGADDANAKNTIFDIYDKLQKGMNWEELCAEFSEDVNSKDKGGRLQPFGVGAMASIPAFQEMAFSLQEPGQISDPVRTQFGWHILRLESRIPLPSFDELKPSLTQRVSRDERVAISRAALRERMREDFGYAEDLSVKEWLLANADNLLAHGQSPQEGEDSVLFTMGGKRYHVRDFIDFARGEGSLRSGTSTKQQLSALLTRFAEDAQVTMLEERIKRESPDYRWLLKEYYEGILLFEIMEQDVWNRAMDDSVGQRKFYAEHAQNYVAGARMAGTIYGSGSRSVVNELQELVKNKKEDLKAFVAANRIRLDSGVFQQEDRTVLTKIPWSPGVYVVENQGINYVVDIREIIPPGRQTFEEARASVISDYQTFLEDSWIRELKRKFVVKVEKKAKKRAFSQLLDQKG